MMSVCTYQVDGCVCVCRLCCTEVEHWMGESGTGSCARVFDLYIMDEIKQGGFMFLRLFIDDSVVPLKKLNIEVF